MEKWKALFQPWILERGREYYVNGRISGISRGDAKISAVVHGNEPYRVEIEYAGEQVTSMRCTCPYAENGANCKHMAAVLYTSKIGRAASSDQGQIRDWNIALEQLSVKALRKIVYNLAINDKELQALILRKHNGLDDGGNGWREDIEWIVGSYADNQNFLDYAVAYDMVQDLVAFLEKHVQWLFEDGKMIEGVKLAGIVYDVVMKQDMDDSDGALALMMESCHDVWDNAMELADDEAQAEIYGCLHCLLEDQEWLYGTDDLEEYLLSRDWEPKLQEKNLKWLDKEISICDEDDDRFLRLLRLRASLMKKLGAKDEELFAFWEKYRAFPVVQEELIGIYEETAPQAAIDLLVEYRNQNHNGLDMEVACTKRLAALYQRTTQHAQYEKELRNLIYHYGCLERYYVEQLKHITLKEDWSETFAQLLALAMTQGERWALLQFDGLYEQLLEELKRKGSLYDFLMYESNLRQYLPEETLDLYSELLKQEMNHASNRAMYRQVIAHLVRLKEYPNGEQAAKAIARCWYERYYSRPAMKDELCRAGFLTEVKP